MIEMEVIEGKGNEDIKKEEKEVMNENRRNEA